MDTPRDVGVPTGEPTPGEKIPQKPSRTKKATEAGKEAANEMAQKGARQIAKQIALAIGRALAQAAASAAAAVAGAIGWPVLIGCFVVFLVALLLFGGLMCIAYNGYFGKSYPREASNNNPSIQKIIQWTNVPSRVTGYNKVVFRYQDDREYVEQGKIDERLAKALEYLASKHESIHISEVRHDYQYMDTSEAGTDTDPRIIKNISAHKEGLAADITLIDFVYKVFEENDTCSAATNGLKGDIVYYNDLNQELLRLPCMGNLWDTTKTNTTWNNQPAEGIPIKIADQDCKPPIEHAGPLPDPCTTITDPTEILVFQKVSQPEARRKTHLAIQELLQFPYNTDNKDYYKVTQLITYSYERDVQPFEKDGTLDKLYGLPRPANYGLFWLKESWQNIHIGY